MNEIIEIIVSPTGQTKLETKGFVGAECKEASKCLETALGEQAREELTAAFFSQQAAAHIMAPAIRVGTDRRLTTRSADDPRCHHRAARQVDLDPHRLLGGIDHQLAHLVGAMLGGPLFGHHAAHHR